MSPNAYWNQAMLHRYSNFQDRASRSEYWWTNAINVLIGLLILDLSTRPGSVRPALALAITVAIFIPEVALTVRRLHDTNRSGWWILILLIPVIGFVTLLAFMLIKSDGGANRYGRPPHWDTWRTQSKQR